MEAAQGAAEFSENDYVGKSVVIKEHVATDDTQLNLKVGDEVYVLEKDETGWWGGHKAGEDSTGWFPGAVLQCPLQPVVRPETLPAVATEPVLPDPGDARHGVSPGPQDSRASPVATRRAHPAGEPGAEEKRVPESRCSPLPASGEGSYMRDGRMVASPQGLEAPRTPVASAPQGAQGAASMCADDEPARLREEVARLRGELQQLRRQSSAEQSRIHELEQLQKRQEQQLKDHASMQGSVSTEAAVLRGKLESERKNSEAQIMANDQMRQRYEERLREKSEDSRRDQDTARKSIQAEQQKALGERRRAEELERQLREAREELDSLRLGRPPATAAEAAPAEQVPAVRPAATEPFGLARGPWSGEPRGAPRPRSPAATEPCGLRPRPLEQRSSPQPRQWSLARSASSLPAATEEDPPRGLVLEKVSIFEERFRSQTPVGRGRAEAPQPCSRPQPAPVGSAPGRLARPASRGPGRQAPAALGEVPARGSGPRPFSLQALHCQTDDEDDDACEGQPFMGMSPIRKAVPSPAVPPPAQLPSGAAPVPAPWDRGAGERSPPGFSPRTREHSERSPSARSDFADVSVSEQIRKFQGARAR